MAGGCAASPLLWLVFYRSDSSILFLVFLHAVRVRASRRVRGWVAQRFLFCLNFFVGLRVQLNQRELLPFLIFLQKSHKIEKHHEFGDESRQHFTR